VANGDGLTGQARRVLVGMQEIEKSQARTRIG
jgi:hypothetical protein